MTLNQSTINEISWCSAAPPTPLNGSVVLSTWLSFATFKYPVVDPKARTYVYCFALFKGCVCYIFASLFFKSKGEHLGNKEKCFLFHFKSSFRSRENQILEF